MSNTELALGRIIEMIILAIRETGEAANLSTVAIEATGTMIPKTGNSESDDVAARGPKYESALNSLPQELRPIYRALVEEYKYYALLRYGRAWVAYDVIADLVKSGWRPTSA